MCEDDREAVALSTGHAFLSKGERSVPWSDKALRIAEENAVSVLIDVVPGEIFANVSLKLRNLVDCNRVPVAPFSFSKHPLPINGEDGIELGIPV